MARLIVPPKELEEKLSRKILLSHRKSILERMAEDSDTSKQTKNDDLS